MVYFVSGLFAVFCIGLFIYAIKIYKEDKKSGLKKREFDDDDFPFHR
jgi:hypothetical protein